jgi:hypothetical protein
MPKFINYECIKYNTQLNKGGTIMSAGRIVLLVFGIIVILVGLGLVLGGGGVLWANSALTDDEGYFSTKTIPIDKDSYAIATEPADVDLGVNWLWMGNLFTIKVEGSNDNPSKQIFIGVAEESDVEAYLSDVEYDEIIDIEINPDRLEYTNRPGNSEPAAPTTETFWTKSAHGSGTQTLEWELESGIWRLVLMNDDGSAGVGLSIVLGAKVSSLVGIGVGFVIGGIVLLAGGGLMVFFAVRKPSRPEQPVPITAETVTEGRGAGSEVNEAGKTD